MSNRQVLTISEIITKEDIECTVNNVSMNLKLIDYEIKSLSEKLGFMGAYHSLVVKVQNSISKEYETLTFFIKSIPYENEEQVSVIEDYRGFYRETNFYKYIEPELLASIEDKSWIAKCYLVKDDALIFEDLKSKGYESKDKILSITHLKAALMSLAKLHASSMLAEKRLDEKFSGRDDANFLEEHLFIRKGKNYMWFQRAVGVAVGVARKLQLDYDCIRKICNCIMKMTNKKTEHKVICHGDLWANNLMFNDSGLSSKCIMVDYQVVHYDLGASDVARLLYLTTTRPFRDKFEKELLKYYHDALSETLLKNNTKIQVPSLNGIMKDYEDTRIVGIITAALYFPTILLNLTICADLLEDSDKFAEIMFEDHAELVLDIMSRDKVYNDRISEVVVEMVERSEELLRNFNDQLFYYSDDTDTNHDMLTLNTI